MTPTPAADSWPALPWKDWRDTASTLHMWTQVVGKIRMVETPWINHSWSVTLYVTPRGLTTAAIPHGERSFRIDFDFIRHRLVIDTSDDRHREVPLEPQTTADFFHRTLGALEELGLPVRIFARPNEVEPAIPFAEDRVHASYDPQAAHRFWRALVAIDRVFTRFRAGFRGKASPSHFFWGSFDLAVTRFSGRAAPPHPGGYPNIPLAVMQEAYSHEVSSAGFWPGGDDFPQPIFYSYAYPSPEGFADAEVLPAAAEWSSALGEWVLPYDAVRKARSPEGVLTEFLETTYLAAARLASWPIDELAQSFRRP